VHLVLKSYQTLGGPHVNGNLVASPSFTRDNPTITQAVLAAQIEANEIIQQRPKDVAAIYIQDMNDKHSVDEVTRIIIDPDNVWTTVPQKLMTFALFMHKVGRLKHAPDRWQDMFLPYVHDGDGS
jgi:NitT/TauT family transport system substrate-binding protein